MPDVVIYYHDAVEVSPSTSWTGLSRQLRAAELVHIDSADDPAVTALFDYARPDAVVVVGGHPVVSIEQTQMNPSGHNIPQRFSCQVRAAELGVPSILYYPEYSRRTFSDPNVRYVQVRVPLAQRRLSRIYQAPALSVFWPTDEQTSLPATGQSAHREMANLVDALISNAGIGAALVGLPGVQAALDGMEMVISKYAHRYRKNRSVRRLLAEGFSGAQARDGVSVDPPAVGTLMTTDDFARSVGRGRATSQWRQVEVALRRRQLTLELRATTNSSQTDSEHPWPGYLTLFDVLYARTEAGISPRQRAVNLVYRLPTNVDGFLYRMNRESVPTATFIVDSFADVIVLEGGVVAGRPMREPGSRARMLVVT